MNKEQKTGSDPPANNQSHKNIKQFKPFYRMIPIFCL